MASQMPNEQYTNPRWQRNPKAEIRDPKEIRIPRAESEAGGRRQNSCALTPVPCFGLRISFGFREFGFRILLSNFGFRFQVENPVDDAADKDGTSLSIEHGGFLIGDWRLAEEAKGVQQHTPKPGGSHCVQSAFRALTRVRVWRG